MRHVTQYGSCFARFGKHSMLLYIHACMHVSFTRPPALRARQYGSRCCAYPSLGFKRICELREREFPPPGH
jgi:hypothetical protein